MKAFIILRDRVTYARKCATALAKAGLDIHVVDHGSTWPAALVWLAELEDDWGLPVLRRKENAYPWQLWEWGPFRDLMEHDNEPYVVTDPDVVPSENCPDDWLERLGEVLARYQCVKVGLSLRIDNVPPSRLEEVLAMEHHFWEDGVPPEEPEFYRANTDTTLALYRPFTQYPLFALGPSLRLAPPYSADHLSWHETGELSPELAHYYAHADPGHAIHRTVAGGG